jgi:hypothetical protein
MPSKQTKGNWMPELDFAGRVLNRVSVVVIAIAAAVFTVLAFGVSRQEGIRAVLLFLIPAAWGAFAFAVLDGQPKAFENVSKTAVPAFGVVAGLVVSSVVILDAPVSVANLALGTMEAFFFVMALASAPTGRKPPISRAQAIWPLSLLLMLTTISIAVAVTV